MKHQEGFLKCVRDANIYCQCWLPEDAPKATLLIVHGLAEHSGRYMSDPLVYTGKTTARLGAELLKAIQRVTAEATKITSLIFIVQGSHDKIVSPDSARMLYDTVGSTDRTMKIYGGLYHEVFNEPEHV